LGGHCAYNLDPQSSATTDKAFCRWFEVDDCDARTVTNTAWSFTWRWRRPLQTTWAFIWRNYPHSLRFCHGATYPIKHRSRDYPQLMLYGNQSRWRPVIFRDCSKRGTTNRPALCTRTSEVFSRCSGDSAFIFSVFVVLREADALWYPAGSIRAELQNTLSCCRLSAM